MSCLNSDKTKLFLIAKDSLEYTRSDIFGSGDSIYVGYGKCEKF